AKLNSGGTHVLRQKFLPQPQRRHRATSGCKLRKKGRLALLSLYWSPQKVSGDGEIGKWAHSQLFQPAAVWVGNSGIERPSYFALRPQMTDTNRDLIPASPGHNYKWRANI